MAPCNGSAAGAYGNPHGRNPCKPNAKAMRAYHPHCRNRLFNLSMYQFIDSGNHRCIRRIGCAGTAKRTPTISARVIFYFLLRLSFFIRMVRAYHPNPRINCLSNDPQASVPYSMDCRRYLHMAVGSFYCPNA